MKKVIIYAFLLLFFMFLFVYIFNSKNKLTQKHVLKFSSWGSQSETKILHSVIKEFEEKNPDIKVEFIHIPQNYFQKIHLLFASGLEPDVLFINNQHIPMYIKAGLLEDLTNYFPSAENDFFKEPLNCFKFQNKLFAIPRDISILVIYYNKDIFKENNINPPSKIKDIYELKSLAQKLATQNNFGINFEEDSLFWLYYLASNGGGAISDDLDKIIINNKKSIEALSLYSDFVNKYYIAPSKSQTGSMTTAQMFINGKLAMYLGGRWMVPKFREIAQFDWDIIPFPSNNNKLYLDSSAWAVSKKSKNKTAAIELIKYLSSEKTINEFSKSGLIIPARKNSAFNIFYHDNKSPKNTMAYVETLKNTKPSPVNENYGTINDILNEKAKSIFNDEKPVDDAFDEKTIKKLESLL